MEQIRLVGKDLDCKEIRRIRGFQPDSFFSPSRSNQSRHMLIRISMGQIAKKIGLNLKLCPLERTNRIKFYDS